MINRIATNMTGHYCASANVIFWITLLEWLQRSYSKNNTGTVCLRHGVVKQWSDFFVLSDYKLPVKQNFTFQVYLASLFHVLTAIYHACRLLHSLHFTLPHSSCRHLLPPIAPDLKMVNWSVLVFGITTNTDITQNQYSPIPNNPMPVLF